VLERKVLEGLGRGREKGREKREEGGGRREEGGRRREEGGGRREEGGGRREEEEEGEKVPAKISTA
jgi:ATP-dependent RNA helicase DHX57